MADKTNIWIWNGTIWVRANADSSGNLRTEENHVGIAPDRKTATGLVNSGETRLHWIVVNPSAGSSNLELTDAVAGGAAVQIDLFHTTRESGQHNFIPPALFSTGLWIETLINYTSVVFGYD